MVSPSEAGEEVTLLVRGTDLADEEVVAGLAAALIPVRQEVERIDGVSGVIDPFLRQTVRKGERCWLLLYPGTITYLRHVWSHPAFRPKMPGRTR